MMGVTRDTKERFDSNYAPFYECVVEDVTSRYWRIDAACTFPKCKMNTGKVLAVGEAAAAVQEFKERVYPLGMKEPVVPRRRGLYDDSDDDYDDDDYDEDYYYDDHDDDHDDE
jgi:hypothetical protein